MNETRDIQTALIKILAIIGFFAILVALTWGAIQGARLLPGAFASLAGMAERIQNYRSVHELTIATERSIVSSEQAFSVTWTDMRAPGSYSVTYRCTEGVTLSVRSAEGEFIAIPCTETLSLSSDVHGLFVMIDSDESRFIDIPFSVAFEYEESGERIQEETIITVVNASIPLAQLDDDPMQDEDDVSTSPDTETVAAETKSPKSTTPPNQGNVVPVQTATVIEYLPTSYESGYTDLIVRYEGVGLMEGTDFVPRAAFERGARGGIRFEVQNSGMRTSESWYFTANLPEGIAYTSEIQAPLAPQERVEFTLGFPIAESTDDSVVITIDVVTDRDLDQKNNLFSWSVGVTE